MKSIMYHYVQKYNSKQKYAKFLNYKNFEKQIIYFKKKYTFFDCRNIDNFFTKNKFEKKIFLTFDDSLKSHYTFVFKILKKYKLNGIFYIPTLPYKNQKILNVHKLHLILNHFGEMEPYNKLKKIIENKMIDNKYKFFFKNKIYKNQKNSYEKNYFKKLLNYYVKNQYKDYLTNKLFKFYFHDINEMKYCKEFYLTEKEINEMSKNGMIFGGHTKSHRILSKLTPKEITNEIKISLDFISQLSPYKTFAYPYGGFHSFNKHAENTLDKNDVKFSMNVENRDINQSDILLRPQALPRFDCNQFPYGKLV